MSDRGGVVTSAILQAVRQCCGCDPDPARAAIENLLRDEFADIQQQTLSEIRLEASEPPAPCRHDL